MATIIIRVEEGDSIESTVSLASAIANATSRTIQFYFNNLPIVVGPNHLPEVVVKDFIKRASTARGDD